jgi:hypothetical protein
MRKRDGMRKKVDMEDGRDEKEIWYEEDGRDEERHEEEEQNLKEEKEQDEEEEQDVAHNFHKRESLWLRKGKGRAWPAV